MLSSLRKGSTTWIAKLFIGLLILSFAVWGVSGIALTSNNQTLAEVGEVEVTQKDYQTMLPIIIKEWNDRLKTKLNNRQLRAFNIPSQVKTRLINQAVFDNHALQLGLGVSEEKIGDEIQNDPQFKDETGNFNKELMKQILLSERISEQDYFDKQRTAALRAQITSIFAMKKVIPKALLNAIYHHREDKRKLSYFVIPESATKKAPEPSEAELKAFYEKNKGNYGAPEFRKVDVIELSLDVIGKSIPIKDEDLKKSYEANIAKYTTKATREYVQMTFETMDKAVAAHKELKDGKKLEEVAKKYAIGENSVPIGPVTESAMADAKIAKAVFALKKDEFTAPIDGTFAITIAKIVKDSPETVKTFDDVKAEITARLQKRAARKKINSLYEQIEDLRGSGMEITKVASEIGHSAKTLVAVDKDGKAPSGDDAKDLPKSAKLLTAIFDADVGDDTLAIRHKDGGFIWFDVKQIIPKRTKTFDEVKAQVKTAFLAQENAKLAAETAAKYVTEIKDGGGFEKVAKKLNAKIKTPDPVGRGAVVEDIPAYLVNKMFTVKTGDIESGLDSSNKAWVIVKVLEAIPAKEEGDAYQAYVIKLNEELQNELTNDLVGQYIEGVKLRYGVQENNAVFEQLKNAF